MNKVSSHPCRSWAEKLAARHPDDVSLAEKMALNEHVKSCTACAAAQIDYTLMTQSIRHLPAVEPLQNIPYQLLQQEVGKRKSSPVQQLVTQSFQSSRLGGKGQPRPAFQPSWFARTVNVVVVVLLLVVITTSALFLFQHRLPGSSLTGAPANHQVTPSLTTSTAQAADQEVCFESDPGSRYVCQHKLYKEFNITRTVQSYTATFTKAYADAARIMLQFSLTFPHPVSSQEAEMTRIDVTLTTPQGQKFWDSSVPVDRVYEKDAIQHVTEVLHFDATNIPLDTQVLNLHLQGEFAIPKQLEVNEHAANKTAPFAFDFSVPFTTSRVITIQQTKTMDGISITLDRAIIAPSETLIFLKSGLLYIPGSGDPYAVSVPDGFPHDNLVSGRGLTFVSGKNSPVTGVELSYDEFLYDRHGAWTVTVYGNAIAGGQVSGQVTWTFQFSYPA